MERAEREPLFKWETLREIRPYTLPYRTPVPGRTCEVELTSGAKVRVWRGDDRQSYFCHGLTFGGKEAPGGPISPFSGQDVVIIVQNHYRRVDPESDGAAGDILVWQAPDGGTPHSAILLDAVIAPGTTQLDYSSKLVTKNGIEPETVMTLEQLITDYYGETYNVYRRD
jgi:hypothetical protein